MTLRNLQGHFCCLKPFQFPYIEMHNVLSTIRFIHLQRAFSNVTFRTAVQRGTRFQLISTIHRSSRYEHITPILQDLHWLRSPERIDFKLAVLVYRCLHGLAPRYLSDYIQSVTDSNRRRLRSSSSSQLVIRRTRLSTVGDRAFPVAGRRLCNSLPPDVTSASTLTVFRNRASKLSFSPNHFLPNCFPFLVLYAVYCSSLAVLYLGHSK